MKIRIALSNYWQEKGKIPAHSEHWKLFNGSFSNKEIEPTIFIKAIQHGYSYTAAHKQYRKKENFICSQILALDFDTEDYKSSFEHLQKNEFIKNHAYAIHTTPSHKPDKPRSRVIFILDEAIYDSKLYGEMSTAVVDYFKLSDNSCKDVARFFYGSKGCEVVLLNNILSLETFNNDILTIYQEKQKKRLERRIQGNTAVRMDVSDRLLSVHKGKLLDHIINANDGTKHLTLLQICRTLGGYISSGYYDFNDIFEQCKNAIIANPHNVKDLKHAFETIETALNYGMNEPLYFNETYRDGIDAIEPKLSDIQKEQVYIVTKAHHDTMREAEIKLWQDLGFSKGIIDMYGLGYQHKKIDEETGEIINDTAFTVPFKDNESILNIEYRYDDRIEYENDLPFLFETDNGRCENQTIVLPDSLTALHTYLHLKNCDYNVVGLPYMDIVTDTIPYDGAIILLEPDTEYRNFKSVREHCRFLNLKTPMKKLLSNGLTAVDLAWYLKQAVRK